MMESHGEVNARLASRDAEVQALAAELAQSRERVQALEEEVRRGKEALSRRESSAALQERELAFLRKLVASFESERAAAQEESDFTGGGGGSGVGIGIGFDAATSMKLEALEDLLKDYKLENLKLQREVDGLSEERLSVGDREGWGKLVGEVDAATKAKAVAEEGTFFFSLFLLFFVPSTSTFF